MGRSSMKRRMAARLEAALPALGVGFALAIVTVSTLAVIFFAAGDHWELATAAFVVAIGAAVGSLVIAARKR